MGSRRGPQPAYAARYGGDPARAQEWERAVLDALDRLGDWASFEEIGAAIQRDDMWVGARGARRALARLTHRREIRHRGGPAEAWRTV